MRLALAQVNPTVGDTVGNAAKVSECVEVAASEGADLVVFSELCVVGYPPRDLLDRRDLVAENVAAVEAIAERCRGVAALVGFVRPAGDGPGPPLEDAVALLAHGRIQQVHVKSLLPNYSVYDDPRYFRPGPGPQCAQVNGRRFGVTICEDLWDAAALGRDLYGADPVAQLIDRGVDLIVNIAASGYQRGKVAQREALFARQARRSGAVIAYVNQVGANDEMVFDGSSCAVGPDGQLLARAASFREDLLLVDTDGEGGRCEPLADEWIRLTEALKLGLADHTRKAGLRGAVLELTADADAAVVAALAADALGAEHVQALVFCDGEAPGELARLGEVLGIALTPLPAGAAAQATRALQAGPAGAELSARIRATVVAAVGEATGRLALSTVNKTDLALGRRARVGDACAVGPLADVVRRDVLRLGEHLSGTGRRIPPRLLRADPPDGEDDLPLDDDVDEIVSLYVESGRTAEEIVADGHDDQRVRRVLATIDSSERTRRRMPMPLQVSARAFGLGRRMPVACRSPAGAAGQGEAQGPRPLGHRRRGRGT